MDVQIRLPIIDYVRNEHVACTMTANQRRPFRPDRPWPTAREAWKSIVFLIAMVASGQYFLAGLESFVTGVPRALSWWLGGLIIVAATFRIESYFDRRRRFQS